MLHPVHALLRLGPIISLCMPFFRLLVCCQPFFFPKFFPPNSLTFKSGLLLSRQVQKWLEHVGLGRLVPLFTEHEVVDDALPHLTSDDLKEMGVKAVGTRRLILNNIELLKQGVLGEAQESVSQ